MLRQLKKYAIEFVVIVLGVTASFFAEQMRQDINAKNELQEKLERAKSECAEFFENASLLESTWKGQAPTLKKISSGVRFSLDTLIQTIDLSQNVGDIRQKYPMLIALSENPSLPKEKLLILQVVKSNFDEFTKDQNDIQVFFKDLYPVFDKYDILGEFLRFQESFLEDVRLKTRNKEFDFNLNGWERFVESRGPFPIKSELLVNDLEARPIIRKIYIAMLRQEVRLFVMKVWLHEFLKDEKG